jgi:hypothetical protein
MKQPRKNKCIKRIQYLCTELDGEPCRFHAKNIDTDEPNRCLYDWHGECSNPKANDAADKEDSEMTIKKVLVVFEDKEAKFLFRQIFGSKLRRYIRCIVKGMTNTLPELDNMIFVPHGDMAITLISPPKNLLPLPGGKRIEALIYRHLFGMKDVDTFWEKIGPGYTRQFALIRQGGIALEKGDDKEWVKNWYKTQSPYWGRGNEKVFKSWVLANKTECLDFCDKFAGLLDRLYTGGLPEQS